MKGRILNFTSVKCFKAEVRKAARMHRCQVKCFLIVFCPKKKVQVKICDSGTVFTALHFNHNLRTSPISQSVCYWQALIA